MDLEKIIEKIDEYKNKTYSETKIVNLSKELKNYSKDDDGYYNRAIELYIASKSLYLIQNANCFKYSFREFSMINKLVLLLLKLREKLSLSEQEVQFLNGILYFRRIHELEKKLTENLERELKEASEICIYNGIRFSYLLTLCAFVEHLVVKKMMSTDETSLQNDIDVIEKNELDDYGVEEIVSSLGIIIDTLNSLPDLKDLPNFIFANRVLTKRTRKILLLACRIRRLQELQQNEEYFGYMCESKDKEFNMISNDTNENILSDYRIGYIKRESATFNFDYSKEKISTIEIIDYMKKVSELEKCSNPVRYRLRVAEQAIKKLCEVGELTKEEKNNLDFETEELNVNKEYYLKPFYRDLTLLDYIRLRRLFAVFYYLQVVPIYKKFIKGEIPEEEYFNSIIPSFKKESFKCLCDIFGEKIDAFWEVSCYKETNSKIIDLYYQPAIPGNSESSYYLLSSIANHSNFGRNIFTLLKKINSKCINEDGTKDVLVSILTKNFDKIGIPNFNGKDIKGISDIDFAFVLENVVYIDQ